VHVEILQKKGVIFGKIPFFYNTKICKVSIWKVVELWMQKASYNIISYITGLDRKTIWRIMSKVSKIIVKSYYSKSLKIGGDQKIIEIDESKFGKIKYNRGHKVEGVWIFGMVERSVEQRIHLVAVDDRKRETLEKELLDNVKSDSILYSDCWKGYTRIIDKFLDNLTVNHSKNFKDLSSDCHTNTIEGNLADIKMHIPFRGRTKDKINLYLIIYMLLRNDNTYPLKSAIKYLF
jgi:transposase-like protein